VNTYKIHPQGNKLIKRENLHTIGATKINTERKYAHVSSKKEERKEGNESMEETQGKLEKFPLSAARARAEVEARERIRGEKRRKGRDERGTLYSSSTPYSSSESRESRSLQAA
jgi:hypothetical protein